MALNLTSVDLYYNTLNVTTVLANPASTTVDLYASFASASAALIGVVSGAKIPSSCIYGYATQGNVGSPTQFTQTNLLGTAGAGLFIATLTAVTSDNTNTTPLAIGLKLSCVSTLPADTYTGTIYFQAQVF